jgi:hypothetical protein
MTVEPASVVLLTMTEAPERQGFLVRLMESTGEPAKMRLSFPLRTPATAVRCSLGGDALEDLQIEDSAVALQINPFAFETIMIEFS